MIQKHLDKDNLHHAYLIEGDRDKIVSEVLKFVESLGIKINNNPDVIHLSLDSFKINDARNLKSFASEKGISADKKIFIISANSFLLEAQNSLLKVLEEPIESTHFFITTPDINSLLKTFVSRFYFISARQPARAGGDIAESVDEAKKFLAMPLKTRLDFIKELLAEIEEDEEESVVLNSTRSKAMKFLNSLEESLHKTVMSRMPLDTNTDVFEHIFKVREVLRIPGSSAKTLLESVALVVPDFKN